MRHLRMTLGLAAVACALAIIAIPASASAHEFVASKAGKTKGVTEEEQKFTFGPIKITCLKATDAGSIGESQLVSETLFTSVKFVKCSTAAKIGLHTIELPTQFKTPFDIEYNANGGAEIGSEETEEEPGVVTLKGGTIEIHVRAGSKFKCNIYVPEQKIKVKKTGPPATFNPSLSKNGKYQSLLISNVFKAIQFEFEGLEPAEQCSEWAKEEGPEGKTGSYTGDLPVELGGGNLEWK